jgi:energy-coupling factor transporter transmembrane protein EcfT
MRGAGGTNGGAGEFLIGLIMLCGGSYLLLNAMRVTSSFGMGSSLYSFNAGGGSYSLTSGYILIPLIFGIGMIFYNSKNIIGWVLSLGSLAGLIFGVITSVRISLQSMSMFDLSVILVLAIGGLGLLLKSLKEK